MKIKDLDLKTNLGSVRIKTPSGRIGYWKSQWEKGVWITDNPGDTRIHPIFVDDLKECLEWEVLPNEPLPLKNKSKK